LVWRRRWCHFFWSPPMSLTSRMLPDRTRTKFTMRPCASATRCLLSPALLSLYRTRGVVRWPADRQCPSRKWPARLRRWRSVADYPVRIAAMRHIHSAVQPTRRQRPANVGHGCDGQRLGAYRQLACQTSSLLGDLAEAFLQRRRSRCRRPIASRKGRCAGRPDDPFGEG
jgi:hypothetical protein